MHHSTGLDFTLVLPRGPSISSSSEIPLKPVLCATGDGPNAFAVIILDRIANHGLARCRKKERRSLHTRLAITTDMGWLKETKMHDPLL